MMDFFKRRWFLLMLAGLLALGMSLPGPLDAGMRQLPGSWRNWVVAFVLFIMALPIDASAMWDAVRRPKSVLIAVGINSGLLPLVAWGMAAFLRRDLAAGLLVAASVPSTIASAAVWTRLAGGNDAVAIQVTMITNVACFIVTPFWLVLTTGAQIASTKLDPWPMIQQLAYVAVLPTIAAQIARTFRPLGRWASAQKMELGVLSQLGILTMVLDGAVHAGGAISAGDVDVGPMLWIEMLASVIALHVSMLWAGHWIGRLLGVNWPDRIAIGFAGSQKTLMLGLHMATEHFGGLAMLPMVFYHLSQLLIDAFVAERFRDVTLAKPEGKAAS